MGSGSCPYVPGSVLVDLSKDMLSVPPASHYDKRIVMDLDKQFLPFKDGSFDSVTMVFLLNYLESPGKVLQEVKRVLKPDGRLFIVQSAEPLNLLYQCQEKEFFDSEKLKIILKTNGFNFDVQQMSCDKDLVFVDCY